MIIKTTNDNTRNNTNHTTTSNSYTDKGVPIIILTIYYLCRGARRGRGGARETVAESHIHIYIYIYIHTYMHNI